jgi:GH43 family beta-xylosidase
MADRYRNPVYAGYFADPFVWRHDGAYYAVGTGGPEANLDLDCVRARVAAAGATSGLFPLLRSEDLVNWTSLGTALSPPDPAFGDYFSAPEVAFAGGAFHLYYSVGRLWQVHQLRVATSRHPEGPYVDSGRRLLHPFECYFANDPSPFCDDDGTWYLFYQRDFVDVDDDAGYRVGGGVVVDRLADMATLRGEPAVVVRPRHDWQRFHARRIRYGQAWDWHLLEGPAVVKRRGRYWCFYSGGDWETCGYGVDYAVADHPGGPWSDDGSEEGPRVLRTVPGRVLGPGHNSVVVGPDGVTDYIVYHAWDPGLRERRMCIDRLEWSDDGPRCTGPTWEEQLIASGPPAPSRTGSDSGHTS